MLKYLDILIDVPSPEIRASWYRHLNCILLPLLIISKEKGTLSLYRSSHHVNFQKIKEIAL